MNSGFRTALKARENLLFVQFKVNFRGRSADLNNICTKALRR